MTRVIKYSLLHMYILDEAPHITDVVILNMLQNAALATSLLLDLVLT